jgi:hypothetical protein
MCADPCATNLIFVDMDMDMDMDMDVDNTQKLSIYRHIDTKDKIYCR